jgi:hypothetical protein
MVTVWFGVGQFLSGVMGQLYPGGDIHQHYPGKQSSITQVYSRGKVNSKSFPLKNNAGKSRLKAYTKILQNAFPRKTTQANRGFCFCLIERIYFLYPSICKQRYFMKI